MADKTTTKQSAKTVPAQVKFNGWPRDPKGGMLWLPLPEKVAALVEGTDEFAASYVCKRGTGKGYTVILAARPAETAKLLAAFKKLVEHPETKALANAAVRRITVEAPEWNKGMTGLRSDGWPLRAKTLESKPVEKPEVKLSDVATHKTKAAPKATAGLRSRPSKNPRTQGRAMVNRVIAKGQETKAIRMATPDEQAQVEAILTAGDRAQE